MARVVPFRKGIGRFVADVVKSWEAGTIVDRVELAVGKGPAVHPRERNPRGRGGGMCDLRGVGVAAVKIAAPHAQNFHSGRRKGRYRDLARPFLCAVTPRYMVAGE
jgi:hypothetical protein